MAPVESAALSEAAPPAAEAPLASRDRPLSVAELIKQAHGTLERTIGTVWVAAEVAQVSRPASGHLYLSLRDKQAVIGAVMWGRDAARLKFTIEPGQKLRVRGKLGVYDRDGKMQLYVDFAEPDGLGAAALALEQLRQKLAGEGLFAQARKRTLPRIPLRIGVVTSATGAAVRDIIRTVERRFARPIVVADCLVQGPAAPASIVAALRAVVAHGVDVVIVGRGGGSANDLSAFNDERVVRAIVACPVPVVSAVGHEVDLSLADLAADLRASTPTAAAELVVPVRADLAVLLRKEEARLDRELRLRLAQERQTVDGVMQRGAFALSRRVATARADLARLDKRLAAAEPRAALRRSRATLHDLVQRLHAHAPGPRVTRERVRLVELHARSTRAFQAHVREARATLVSAGGQLHALSPLAVLERGYAVVRNADGVVHARAQAAPGQALAIRIVDGIVRAEVTSVEALPAEPATAAATTPPADGPKRKRGGKPA